MKMLKLGKWNFDVSKVIGFVFGVIFTTCVTVLAETCQTTLSSNSVTYDNTTVEATTTSLLSQAGNIDNRVSTLEGKFLNGTSAYFDGADSGDILYIGKGNSTADTRGVYLYGSNNVLRSTYIFDKANQKIKLTANSTTTSGAGPLEIIGKPITIDATTGGNGNLNLNGNVKINGSPVTVTINGRSSSSNLNTIYSNQPDETVWFISGQNEQNQASGSGTIHFIISYRVNASWGSQWLFQGGNIYSRSMNNGTWNAWGQRL